MEKKSEVRINKNLILSVGQIISVTAELAADETERDAGLHKNKRAALDKQIDSIIHELYDLSDAEIQVVERTISEREFAGQSLMPPSQIEMRR